MTQIDILSLLPLVADRGWRQVRRGKEEAGGGEIRDRDGRCPICALANEIDPLSPWHSYVKGAAQAMGLPTSLAILNDIAQAADNQLHPLRKQLRQALGMS